MEARAEYLGRSERPRLTVVTDGGGSYSALPHAVLFSDLSAGAVRLYAVMQAHWWQSGECFASHATLAAEMRCSDSQLRRYIGELVQAGAITARRAGHGQAKAYSPCQPLTGERLNCSPVSTLESNRSPVAPQPFTGGDLNRSPVDVPYKKTPVKKKEELATTLLDAANAAPAPVEKVKPEARARRLPEDWSLTPEHIRAAEKKGLGAARAAVEAEKFCDYHRAKGTRMLDWMAAWRTWLGNAVTFDGRRSTTTRNGTAPMPPGATSKQSSTWAGHRNRHGGNLSAPVEGVTP